MCSPFPLPRNCLRLGPQPCEWLANTLHCFYVDSSCLLLQYYPHTKSFLLLPLYPYLFHIALGPCTHNRFPRCTCYACSKKNNCNSKCKANGAIAPSHVPGTQSPWLLFSFKEKKLQISRTKHGIFTLQSYRLCRCWFSRAKMASYCGES